MSEQLLLGYIGDIDGNDDHLVAMDAVVEDAGQLFRYPASGGDRIAIDAGDLDYVHNATRDLAKRWDVGDVIWFAGRHLVTRSATDVVLRRFAASWTLTAQGHRMRTGNASELRRWRDHNAGRLSTYLYRYLMDPMEREVGQAQTTLELYLAIENVAVPRRFLNTALFYHEQYDYDSYEFERDRAVRSGAFTDLEEFDTRFDKLRTFVRSDRLLDVSGYASRQRVLSRSDDTMSALQVFLMASSARNGRSFNLDAVNVDWDNLHARFRRGHGDAIASIVENAGVLDERSV